VVVHGYSTASEWQVSTAPLEGRLIVQAQLFSARHWRELAHTEWLEADDLLQGLPELGRVDLAADANSPWNHVGHKATIYQPEPCRESERYTGDRDVNLLGHWPDDVWALVGEYGEEWCTRTSILHRWTKGRFVEVFRTGGVGDFFESVVTWRHGLAALEDQSCATRLNEVGHRRVLAFSAATHDVLTDVRNDQLYNIGLKRLHNLLVLYGNGADERIELVTWANKGSTQRHRLHTRVGTTDVTVQDNRITFHFLPEQGTASAVDATFDGAWHESKPHAVPERHDSAAEFAHLFPSEPGVSVEASWSSNGRDWLLVKRLADSGGPQEIWLLSNQSVSSIWELPDIQYSTRAKCATSDGPAKTGVPHLG
jgi:hypothetical protein